jgi:Na+-driven multidrug efflux pump
MIKRFQLSRLVSCLNLTHDEALANVASNFNLRRYEKVADRLLVWGTLLGVFLGSLQACSLPLIQVITPLAEVQELARMPVLIGAVQMPLNGLVFVCEVGRYRFTPS